MRVWMSIILIIILVIPGGYAFTHWMISRIDPFRVGVHFAQSDSQLSSIVATVGKCNPPWLSSEHYCYSSNKGYADLHIWLLGRQHAGMLTVHLDMEAGNWRVTKAHLEVSDGGSLTIK